MTDFRGRLDGSGKRFALVASRFNELVTERLVAGARSCFVEVQVKARRIQASSRSAFEGSRSARA